MSRPIKPYAEVKALLGPAAPAWEKTLGQIRAHYAMDEDWKEGKPSHKHYNNLFVRRGGKSLILFALREGYFMVCVVLGKDEREKFEVVRDTFPLAIQELYDAAETYHDGKWIGFDAYDDTLTEYVLPLLMLKRKPNRKVIPESIEGLGQLDVGFSHQEITGFVEGL